MIKIAVLFLYVYAVYFGCCLLYVCLEVFFVWPKRPSKKNSMSGNTRSLSFHATKTALPAAQSGNVTISGSLTWALHWHSREHIYKATLHQTSLKLFNYRTPSEVTGELQTEEMPGSMMRSFSIMMTHEMSFDEITALNVIKHLLPLFFILLFD